jgi:[histone H3]-lysine9 N-trimethyltransferase EHMT
VRSDLKASATMRSRGLWLNRNMRIVGAIPGICIGDVFLYRMELCVVGLHGEPQAGIDYLPGSMSSNGDPIATSVIVSGGYEGDVDEGDVIILSGHGGQDKNRRQVFHQKLEGGDLAMERSMHYGIEVRVIRAVRYEGTSSTSGKVYVYDGLYKIVESWCDVGKSGFGVFKFMLSRIDDQAKMGSLVLKEAFLRRNDPDYKPMCIISPDISNGMERVGIRLFNDIDECKDEKW